LAFPFQTDSSLRYAYRFPAHEQRDIYTHFPQAPVHTDSLTDYHTELRIIPTEEGEGAELRRPVIKPAAVVEQRVSHFVMGLGVIGTMTGPLLIVLHTMPNAVFSGVFFSVGWGSVGANGIMQKVVYLFRENRFIQRDEPLLKVRNRKIFLFAACQIIGVAACVAISQTIAAIGMHLQPVSTDG
jgi:hypothetical protein